MEGCKDGIWVDSNRRGHRLFDCEEGKGLFYPATSLKIYKQDSRPGHTLNNRK